MEDHSTQSEIDQFILNHIESVPHLEALLLMWRSMPAIWTLEELAQRLYMPPERVKRVVEDLVQMNLVAARSDLPVKYSYNTGSAEHERLIRSVQETYQRELVRITNLIHSKPSAAVREFARAFRFTKERE